MVETTKDLIMKVVELLGGHSYICNQLMSVHKYSKYAYNTEIQISKHVS